MPPAEAGGALLSAIEHETGPTLGLADGTVRRSEAELAADAQPVAIVMLHKRADPKKVPIGQAFVDRIVAVHETGEADRAGSLGGCHWCGTPETMTSLVTRKTILAFHHRGQKIRQKIEKIARPISEADADRLP